MIKKFLIFSLAGIFAVAFFELFLRFSPFSYGISPVVYDKDIGMWHKKNFSGNIIKECYTTAYSFDGQGLIKNDYVYDSKKDNVIVIGDSYIEALMVKNENVMHNALYKVYEGKYNFLNYGLSETSPVQQLIMMEKKVDFTAVKSLLQFIRIESDIYDVDVNNLEATARPKAFLEFSDLENYKVIPPRKQDTKEQFRDLLGNFELYIFLKKGIYFLKSQLSDKNVQKARVKNVDLSHNWLQIKGALYQTKKLLEEKKIGYTVILYGKDMALNKILKSFLEAQHIHYHDIYMLTKEKGLELEGFPCDSHWTDKTHNAVAKLIKEEEILK